MARSKKGRKKDGVVAATSGSVSEDIEAAPAEVVAAEETESEVTPDEVEVLPAESDEIEEYDSSLPALESESGREPGGLVRYDALTAYLNEISRYPHLTREEESALAVRYYENKDVEAAYKLITSNLWLVVKLAREYERAARSLLDLVQEGNIGLMEAVRNFDPYRGVRFPSYAVWWIKAYIIRFVIANWRLVKIGTTQAQRKLFFNLKKEREKLEREGFRPEPKLLAEKLNVRESDVVEMEQRLSSPDISVDGPVSDDSDGNLLNVLPSGELTAEDLVVRKEMQRNLAQGLEEFASTLKEKELIIFRERMLSEEKATLHEIAEKLSLSKERVRQIEQKIKEKLKSFLLSRLGLAESFDFE
ncbi:MAG: RNA polymerase factor sigma-32 [Deltaproteobacteria bacterium]|nr:RNA polymerase factor sigma-32 [Deltaproteobacteria bacterium]